MVQEEHIFKYGSLNKHGVEKMLFNLKSP